MSLVARRGIGGTQLLPNLLNLLNLPNLLDLLDLLNLLDLGESAKGGRAGLAKQGGAPVTWAPRRPCSGRRTLLCAYVSNFLLT